MKILEKIVLSAFVVALSAMAPDLAEAQGRGGGFRFYCAEIDAAAAHRLRIEHMLHEALETLWSFVGEANKFVEAEQRGDDHVVVWGTGRASREFLYVEDCACAIAMATEGLLTLPAGSMLASNREQRPRRPAYGSRLTAHGSRLTKPANHR